MLLPKDSSTKRKSNPSAESQRPTKRTKSKHTVSPVTISVHPSTASNASAHAEDTPGPDIRPSHEAPVISAPDFFPYAHHFVINNPTMIANRITHMFDTGKTVLKLLNTKRMIGAEADSSARDPPPRCHPDTRKTLRTSITHWVTDVHRHWRMLWIMGPAGVGKSAVAQTIAEDFTASGRLGAALFFSRLNQRDNPEQVIPTLSYQLAVQLPEYKRIITERLADDPTILEKNRRAQFRELIIQPFHILMTQHPSAVPQPFLIIIDGLDECSNKEAQCEFIELISSHVRQVETFPLLWMVCSRPEWHLKYLVSEPDFGVSCKREELSVEDTEAQQDVTRVLRDGFRDIRRKYRDRLEADWPSEADIRQISKNASGLFAFASTLVRFVGDSQRSDPRGRLHLCIRFLGGSGTPGAINPLHALDLLYRHILSDIPRENLPITIRILGFSIVYSYVRLSALAQTLFLDIDKDTFHRALEQLHSVLDVPSTTDAHSRHLFFYHASFGDYLRDSNRSGSFAIDESAVHRDVILHSLRLQILDLQSVQEHQNQPSGRHTHSPLPNTSNVLPNLPRLKKFSYNIALTACHRVSNKDLPSLIAELECFDFSKVKRISEKFGDFLVWLHNLGHRNKSLIRMGTLGVSGRTGALTFTRRVDSPTGFLRSFGRFSGDKLYFRVGWGDRSRDFIVHVNGAPERSDLPLWEDVWE